MHTKSLRNNDGRAHDRNIFSNSTSRWRMLLAKAKTTSGFPSSSLDLHTCLHRIPRLPTTISRKLEGRSTWANLGSSCSSEERQEPKRILSLTKTKITTCSISPSPNFRIWEQDPNNGIMLLTLAWAYIMSADLAERQRLRMCYDENVSTSGVSADLSILDLWYASRKERRWWKALTSLGVGWSSTGSKLSPWALRLEHINIQILGGLDCDQQPPTAHEAACYLSRFCDAFNLGSQCSVALAAALTIPLHASAMPLKQAAVMLPQPTFKTGSRKPSSSLPPLEFENISYFMTLSLCPWALGPSLWSVFWHPRVPCDQVGAWMLPIIDILRPIIHGDDMELLAKLLSFNRMAPLWLGLAVTGQGVIIKSLIPSLELRETPFFGPNIDAAAWTGTMQSFLDCPEWTPCSTAAVSRTQVWRLRHHFSTEYTDNAFQQAPEHGWYPFGEMLDKDVELEIRQHLSCSHWFEYRYWTWLPRGQADTGFISTGEGAGWNCSDTWTTVSLEEIDACTNSELALSISRRATRGAFSWCFNQVEKGFGGTVVPFHREVDESFGEVKVANRIDTERIQAWLSTVAS